MLPQSLLRTSVSVEGERLVPHYFTARDEAWLNALIEGWRGLVGRRRAELHRLTREAARLRASKAKLRVAVHVLDRLCQTRPKPPLPPKQVRLAVFGQAASSDGSREGVLGSVAFALGVSISDLERSLLADLGGEASIAAPPEDLSAARLLAEANLSIVMALVRRAAQVRISVWSEGQSLVRRARALGLICSVFPLRLKGDADHGESDEGDADQGDPDERESAISGVTLDVSGPFSLFRHTDLYAGALGSLLRLAVQFPKYRLTARCALQRGSALATLVLGPGDPLGRDRCAAPPTTALHARFARDFQRLAPAWHVIANPAPRLAGQNLLYPEFELVHVQQPERRWWVELVGFWTSRSISEKLYQLRLAGLERFILCVDRRRSCAAGDLPSDARVIGFKTRIDVGALLALIEQQS